MNTHNQAEQSSTGSAPQSPFMSQQQQQQQQQQGGQARQSGSYPSPTSYPSPGMSNAQQYAYPVPGQQGNEPYRASPTGSNGSLNLPSMRESLPPPQHTQQHMNQNLPPPGQMGGPYYPPHQGMQYPNVTSDPMRQMQYALPPAEQRVMSGGRHKKPQEIKRRTKTGCLTCRKRRIKCDEGHPACRNCQKSKRECLGYDPIFKAQQQGPTAIQPAPSASPSQVTTLATANPYGNQPVLQGYGQPSNMAFDPALSAAVNSPNNGPQYPDFGASAIDPALEAAAAPASSTNGHQYTQSIPGMPTPRESWQVDAEDRSLFNSLVCDVVHLRGGDIHFDCPASPATSAHSPMFPRTYASTGKVKVDQLLDQGGLIPPMTPEVTEKLQDSAMLDEVKHLYHSIYSTGLENFLESKWFMSKGVSKLLADTNTLELFITLLDQFKTNQDTSDAAAMAYTSSVEARVVWALACMVREAGVEGSNGVVKNEQPGFPPIDDPVEAGNRLTVFENLICGAVAPNPLSRAIPGSAQDHHRIRELEFWYQLGHFVSLHDDGGPSFSIEIDNTMTNLRGLLDGRENRDVLYSIVVVRAFGPRVAEYTEQDKPLHLDESDARSKLAVAKKFVKDEGAGAGTTNVIRRLCELSTRSWETVVAAPALVS